jgi:hypothetical protein
MQMALNEFGAKLDKNGYAPSLFDTTPNTCYLCGREIPTERHEIFGGARRDKSKAYGLWVNLCGGCHRTDKNAVHQSKNVAMKMKRIGQKKAMRTYKWSQEEWMNRFFKNYVEVEKDV